MTVSTRILIRQARVYDPSQGWTGELRDLYVSEGRISEAFKEPEQIIDAGGRPLLAGGIDPYCQLAPYGQSLTRMFGGSPSPEEVGRTYARMGYVHVHNPFTNLLTARLVRHVLRLVPFVDTSTCVTIDLRDMGACIRSNQPVEFSRLGRALIRLTGALGLSLPFPNLRHKERHYVQKNLSAKKVLSFLSFLEDPDLLPIHLWGMPGLLDNEIPRPAAFHIAGLGFALDSETSVDQARGFLEAGGSADLGLSTGQEQLVVSAGSTMRQATYSLDVGTQTPLAFDVRPIALDHGMTSAGWSLLGRALSSCPLALGASGPAGGQFGGMPRVATWLLDPDARPEELRKALDGTSFDLAAWAQRTRSEPARSIGLTDLGHLRVGARASLVVYDMHPESRGEAITEALRDCWCLIKDGVVVRQGGAFTGAKPPVDLRCRELDVDLSGLSQTDLLQNPTLRTEHLDVKGCAIEQGRNR
jgi:hypothetical protein